jgi:Family of unknown function (DUF6228)
VTGIELGDASTRLMLTPDDPDHTPPQCVIAELRAGSLIATRRVGHHASGVTDSAAFAETLSANWRGRPDERVWEPIEHDLRIQAHHDGHVRLRVRHQDTDTWTWSTVKIIAEGSPLMLEMAPVRRWAVHRTVT